MAGMLRKRDEQLAKVLGALADSTRRTILEDLSRREDQSLFEILARLVEKHQLSITRQAVSKHLKVLERAGLITRAVDRQRRPARLNAAPMRDAVAWLEEFKDFWAGSFDQLDALLSDLKQSEMKDPRDE